MHRSMHTLIAVFIWLTEKILFAWYYTLDIYPQQNQLLRMRICMSTSRFQRGTFTQSKKYNLRREYTQKCCYPYLKIMLQPLIFPYKVKVLCNFNLWVNFLGKLDLCFFKESRTNFSFNKNGGSLMVESSFVWNMLGLNDFQSDFIWKLC